MEDKRGKEFEKIASPNKQGISSDIKLNSLPDNLKVTNGSSYSREGSYLDEKYYLIKNYEKGSINTKNEDQKKGIGKGKLQSIQLAGFKK
jgi:hypothetical protein